MLAARRLVSSLMSPNFPIPGLEFRQLFQLFRAQLLIRYCGLPGSRVPGRLSG
jgi:hypothetical protein